MGEAIGLETVESFKDNPGDQSILPLETEAFICTLPPSQKDVSAPASALGALTLTITESNPKHPPPISIVSK